MKSNPRTLQRVITSGALVLGVMALATGCSPGDPLPPGAAPLDYQHDRYWAALGDRSGDPCDRDWPDAPDQQAGAPVDAFYLHPTTLGLDSGEVANGDADDTGQRADIDATLATQMAAFSASTRIFAPYYRQVSLGTFAADPTGAVVKAAMQGAYGDVVAAFDEFITHRSGDRPFVLVGHSQGSMWLVRLLKERIEGQPLQNRLVAAYVVGEFIGPDTFSTLPVCDGPSATGCVLSWATLGKNGTPHMACGHATLSKDCRAAPVHTAETPVCSNPLDWSHQARRQPYVAAHARRSGPFDGEFVDGWFTASCQDGLLRIDDEVDVTGIGTLHDALSSAIEFGDYHPVDLELMYGDVRDNLAVRVAAFEAQK